MHNVICHAPCMTQ